MKNSYIFLLTITLFLLGCSSSENTSKNKSMHVVNATYEQWSEPPAAGSEIPERGTDLTITIRNWPEGYIPQYIVYDGRKSAAATISNQKDTTVIIRGRIIRTSSMIVETSKSVDVSDRLVFTDSKGDTGFIEIENWNNK